MPPLNFAVRRLLNRPAIPAELKRQILVEAGHRCAIPTCRATTTEIAHIIAWSETKSHDPDNLIALCPNCHTRFDAGQIDKQAMQIYKQKLRFLSDRYSRFEMRVLDHLRKAPRAIVGGTLMVKALLDDGLIELHEELSSIVFNDGYEDWITGTVKLTDAGKVFLERWDSPETRGLTYGDA